MEKSYKVFMLKILIKRMYLGWFVKQVEPQPKEQK